MSLKIYVLHSQLDFFPNNCGMASEERDEPFRQEIATTEERYEGKWSTSMLADCCWMLVRNAAELHKQHVKRSRKRKWTFIVTCLMHIFLKYTGCNRRNGPDFRMVFLMLNYTEKPQNTYIQS